MPAGGTGYQRPEWTGAEKKKLAKSFLASEFAAGLDDSDYRGLLGDLIWFGADFGPGDPLRWSPVAVEIILVDWIPRKLQADVEYLAKAPRLLRAFVRYCHQERNIRPELQPARWPPSTVTSPSTRSSSGRHGCRARLLCSPRWARWIRTVPRT